MGTHLGFSTTHKVDDAITRISVFGPIYGMAMPAEPLETLIAGHVPREKFLEAADGYRTKWWDYRRLSPAHSLMLFTDNYYKHFKLAARKSLVHKGRDPRLKALHGSAYSQMTTEEMWEREPSHITGLWTAMTVADTYGIPYDYFCMTAMNMAMDTNWTRLPTPSQLYSPNLGALTITQWEKDQFQQLYTAQHPLYSLDNDVGLPLQEEYRNWIMERLVMLDAPLHPLTGVLFRRPQITEALARTKFSDNLIERARLVAC